MVKESAPVGDAVTKPDYDEEGQPKPTAPNRTDAGGIDSSTQLNASDLGSGLPGVSAAKLEEARRIVAMADAASEPFAKGKDGRLPHVLKTNLDVRRGDKVFRIPAGSVVTDTELTDEEFDTALANNIVGEATIGQMQAHAARLAAADHAETEKERRRDAIGVSPKGSKGDAQPPGSTLVVDLAEGQRLEAARVAAHNLAVEGARRPMPAAPAPATKSASARKR